MTLTNAPIIESCELLLRGPEKQDVEPIISFLQDEVRAKGFGHIAERGEAWRWFALNIGHWHIHHYGYFTVETKSGEIAGITGIWNPETWPEPEIGWVLFEGFEGRGLAFQAASLIRQWAYEQLQFTTLTSNVRPDNKRSIRLAKRLGAKFDRSYRNSNMGETHLYRHPNPENL